MSGKKDGQVVLKLISRADGTSCEGVGFYFIDFDPAANEGRGRASFVRSWTKARIFDDLDDAIEFTSRLFTPSSETDGCRSLMRYIFHAYKIRELADVERAGATVH